MTGQSQQEWPRSATAPATFVAPHYDDAVLSCGEAIAGMPGSRVITVFSCGPSPTDPLSPWDRECGFTPGDNVAAVRRREDDEALHLLGAQGTALGFLPAQYRPAARSGSTGLSKVIARLRRRDLTESQLRTAISARFAEALQASEVKTCIVPLGVSHPDHVLTTSIALSLIASVPACRWVAYADLPYSAERPAHVDAARRRILAAGFALEPIALPSRSGSPLKERAVRRYASQVQGLGDRALLAVRRPEIYYELVSLTSDPSRERPA